MGSSRILKKAAYSNEIMEIPTNAQMNFSVVKVEINPNKVFTMPAAHSALIARVTASAALRSSVLVQTALRLMLNRNALLKSRSRPALKGLAA